MIYRYGKEAKKIDNQTRLKSFQPNLTLNHKIYVHHLVMGFFFFNFILALHSSIKAPQFLKKLDTSFVFH